MSQLFLLFARFGTPLLLSGTALAFTQFLHDLPWVGTVALVMIVAGLVLLFVPRPRSKRPPVEVRAPVRGRWVAVNSPANHVPSHGTHEFGQTYAIDLVYHPDPDADWKGMHSWPLARPARSFPGFGQPILAPADGVVVHVAHGRRDHWSRNSWPALVYLFTVELLVRGVVSAVLPSVVLGNHVVLDLGDGVYAALAHLRRGSIRVRPGQRVRAGEEIGECGNSGNTSEPHVHFQLMDHRLPMLAVGIPFTFADQADGVPRTKQAFTAGISDHR
jgi:murein DD-endopeptidase MepM/ murein hydrolase activator NlpD